MAFSAEWLGLRESADHAARSEALTEAVAARVARSSPATVVDLATGTGSNARFLLPRLPGHQEWHLLDRDPVLLATLARQMAVWGAAHGYQARSDESGVTLSDAGHVRRLRSSLRDLSILDGSSRIEGLTNLPAAPERPEPALPSSFDSWSSAAPAAEPISAALVAPLVTPFITTAALIDLVSEAWIHALAAHCRAVRAVVLVALTYDGRIVCAPGEPEDETVRVLVNTHQRLDKGFGPAVGPDGTDITERALAEQGYATRRAPSDWVLGPSQAELQRQLLAGWADAAAEIAPADMHIIRAWFARRLAHVDAGRSEIVVGHQDLAAWLPDGIEAEPATANPATVER